MSNAAWTLPLGRHEAHFATRMLALTILCVRVAVRHYCSSRSRQALAAWNSPPDYSWKGTVLGAHTVFKTLGEACDFIFKPRFLRVASAQSWLLIVQPVFVLNPLTKARLASLVAGSACDWGTVFTSVPHCVLISPARVQASTCHSLLDPRTDREAGLSPTGPVFL